MGVRRNDTSAQPTSGAGALTAPPPRARACDGVAGSADPVRVLLERHRRLCRDAVDPLEIAAGLEADGLTDRGAARYRHRDVFSLAEELYARTPSPGAEADPGEGGIDGVRPPRTVGGWLPLGFLCTGAVLLLSRWEPSGPVRWVVSALGVLAATAVLLRFLRRAAPSAVAAASLVLLVCGAVYGDGLFRAALAGGPEELSARADWSMPLTLVWAGVLGPGCARWFAVRAGARLTESRSLAVFAAAVRPLLMLTVLAFLGLVLAVWAVAHHLLEVDGEGGVTGVRWLLAGSLGLLMFLTLLLSAHGFRHTAATALTCAAGLQLLALALVFAARLPFLGWLDVPVALLVTACGEAAVAVVCCLTAGVATLCRACRLLTGASAHRGTSAVRTRRGN